MFSIIHFLHSEPDSNQYQRFWRPGCCHYTIGVFFANPSGFEPELQESKSWVLPVTLWISVMLFCGTDRNRTCTFSFSD